MKIAFIGQKGIPALSGGVEKHVEQVAIRLAAEGHEVFVYVRDHYTPTDLSEYQGVKLVHVGSIRTKHLDAMTHTLFATLHALTQPYDIIHYQSIGPALLSFLPRLFKRRTQVMATFHCQDYHHKKWGVVARAVLRLGERVTCTVPHATFAVSRNLARLSQERYSRAAILISNGANVGRTEATDRLAAFGLKEGRYVLAVSRLVGHKGVHYLIKAFTQLGDTNQLPNNFKLVIVGKDAGTPEYADFLKHMATGRENIVFAGEQTGETLEQLFSHAALFVQPSESEGLSVALLEAMGHGLPVIASDIEPNCEALGDDGVVFRSKDVDDLKKTLASLINKPEEMARLGKRAAERIQHEYSWDAVVARLTHAYADAVADNK